MPIKLVRVRGQGRIFQRGNRWWIAYYAPQDGRSVEIRESGGGTEEAANKKLERRLREVQNDREGVRHFQGPKRERVTVKELLERLEHEYQTKGQSWRRANSHLKHIREAFGTARALAVTSARLDDYVVRRQKDGAKSATINRELELLQRAFNLAVEKKRLAKADVPSFPRLPEHNARQGFFARADFDQVLSHVTVRGKPDHDVRDYLEWFFWTGMRPGETKSLRWPSFDLETWTLRLPAKDAKTRCGRVVPIQGPLQEILRRRLTARRLDCPFIFHRSGRQLGDFEKVWKRACIVAGVATGTWDKTKREWINYCGPIPYDLRRTAVRNMIRAGVDPAEAKKISGHRTDSMLERYNIIDEKDLEEAIHKTATYVRNLPTHSNVIPLQKRG